MPGHLCALQSPSSGVEQVHSVSTVRDRMEQVKTLFAAHPHTLHDKHAKHDHDDHRDKLEQTKLRDRALKENAKLERDGKKGEKEEARLAAAAAYRMDRAYSGQSKRAAKDAREADKREHRHEEGERIGECEHGVWRCKICNPVTKHK